MSERSEGGPEGPLAPHLARFRSELSTLGYSKSAAKKQIQLAVHLSRWLEGDGLEVAELATKRVSSFLAARRERGYANLRTPRSVLPLVEYLRSLGVIGQPEAPVAVDELDVLAERFRLYLMQERGLVEGTTWFYLRVARLFVAERRDAGGNAELGLASMKAADVTGFVTRTCEHLSLSSSRQTVSALRSLLRFLQMEGLIQLALDQAVLSVAGSSGALPRAMETGHVTRLLASCDRRRGKGQRDYAILMLLSRLGLRSGEVARVELDDLDWRAGELVVHGKGRRRDRLPLPADVGEALAAYLRRGRPHSDSRRLFLRWFAPFVGFADSGAIRGVVADACARSGVPYACPHRLRHSLATEMLRAGAPLSEIGQVLRHRSAATTAIYAAVDHDQLRRLARPWPGGAA